VPGRELNFRPLERHFVCGVEFLSPAGGFWRTAIFQSACLLYLWNPFSLCMSSWKVFKRKERLSARNEMPRESAFVRATIVPLAVPLEQSSDNKNICMNRIQYELFIKLLAQRFVIIT